MSPVRILAGRRILLGVSGSIAAYKAALTASQLTRSGALVDAVLTGAAQRFVGTATFEGLTGRRAYGHVGAMTESGEIAHVEVGLAADGALIAPATAETIAQLVSGRADNILTAAMLSVRGPVLIAPAMESAMLASPPVQANLETLRARGAMIVEAPSGRLASGHFGPGRLAEPQFQIDQLRAALGAEGPLKDRRVVVTAGGTREYIDAVRFISNPSSGAQGVALAEAARDRGALVTLIAANLTVRPPAAIQVRYADDAAAMAAAVAEKGAVDALIMCAAVGDFQPVHRRTDKLSRSDGLMLELEPTQDIVAGARGPAVKIGFALNNRDLAADAQAKLAVKGLQAIVANDPSAAGAGFGPGTNAVSIYTEKGLWDQIGPVPKSEVAERIIDLLEDLLS